MFSLDNIVSGANGGGGGGWGGLTHEIYSRRNKDNLGLVFFFSCLFLSAFISITVT